MFLKLLKMLCFLCFVSRSFGDIPFFLTSNRQNIHKNSFIRANSEVPCSNFYEYSCTKWKNETKKPAYELSWNHFTAASYEIKRKIQHILESPVESQYPYLHQAQLFYNACIHFDKFEDQYLADLRTLVDYFKGWPITKPNWFVNGYNWLEEVALVTRKLGFHPLVKFHVGIDYKNTKKYVLYIEPGSLIFPQTILLNPSQFRVELLAYEEWITRSIQYLFFKKRTSRDLNVEVKKIIGFEQKLAKFRSMEPKMEKNTTQFFSEKFNVNFPEIFEILFSDLGKEINLPDAIVIKNYDYFKNLIGFMKRTSKRKVANYLIWTIVKEFSRHTSAHFKMLNFFIDQTVLGITSDISREIECTNKVMDYFSFAILPKYLKLYFKSDLTKPVQEMAEHIKDEYVNLLMQNTWLSDDTKMLAIEKARKIECIVGYSEWMNDNTELEHYYDKLTITSDHFKNVIKVKQLKIERNLLMLGATVSTPLWPSNIFDVNAYYSILQNLVFVPLGILQEPFYHENGPRIFNYGALGSLVGHEFSHSLDTSGRQANSNGNIVEWWPIKDISGYKLKSKCFELNNENRQTDVLLIGENIADNVGLDISYKAYKKQKNTALEDFFWNFEDERIFFLSYAQVWCEIADRSSDLYYDEHTSVEIRVNQAVSNNRHFNEIFGCTKNLNICKLW